MTTPNSNFERMAFAAFRYCLSESLALPGVLSARDKEAAQAVAAGLRDAKAANTRRVYASAWHEFNVWALANGRQSLPAEPQTVALYLGRLAADGRAMATHCGELGVTICGEPFGHLLLWRTAGHDLPSMFPADCYAEPSMYPKT